MIALSLIELRAIASQRPKGYLDDLLSARSARVAGDILWLDTGDYHALCIKYAGSRPLKATVGEPTDPTVVDLAANFATATAKWAARGFPVVDQATYAARAAVCEACEYWDGAARLGLGKCRQPKCGCTRFKRWLATERCPIARWPS